MKIQYLTQLFQNQKYSVFQAPPSFDDAVKMSPFNPSQSVSGYGAAAQPSSAPSAPLAQWESSAPSLEKKVDLSSLTNYD